MTLLAAIYRGHVAPFGRLTLEEAENAWNAGRLTRQQWRAYRLFWNWGTPRFSDVIGAKHEATFNRNRRRYYSRINRFRRAMGLAEIRDHGDQERG